MLDGVVFFAKIEEENEVNWMVQDRNPEYFLAIASEKSISKAAERLHISQPYLSQYVIHLEKEFGVRLLDRTKSPLALTAAVLYGFGVPMSTVGLSVWAEAFSGAKRYDEVIRLFQTGYGLGALVFSFMPGLFADACGSYAPSYLVFLAFGVFSLLVVQSTYRRTARSRSVL